MLTLARLSSAAALAALPLSIAVAQPPAQGAPPQQGVGRGQEPPAPPPATFQFMGPASGGRIASVTGVPGDTMTWYLGAASGGIWKSVDAGRSFAPIFDQMNVQAIGALAVASSDPRIVWAGTGEAWAIR